MGKQPTQQRLRKASRRLIRQVKHAVSGKTLEQDGYQGIRWHLDFPSLHHPAWLTPSGWVVQGWVLLPEHLTDLTGDVRLVAQWASAFELRHPLSLKRPDVIKEVLAEDNQDHPQAVCGFRFTVPRHLASFTLSVYVGDECVAAQHVDMPEVDEAQALKEAQIKVLEGEQGWLFLDNDTNGSVDQYCGRLVLTTEGIGAWQGYLAGLHRLAEKNAAKCAMLVAPSKESVMGPRYHPYAEGTGGPMHQMMALKEASEVIYPVEALRALGDDAFIVTDTHWSQQGALQAAKKLAEALGLEAQAIAQTFAADQYHIRQLPGDLGSKLTPPRQCEIKVLRSFSYSKHRYFDNGLPNFGRLLVLVNDKALMSGTCLIFGSSSSYSMFNYVCRLFQRVVFVHSAGNLDPELVSAVSPAYLVVQTNARFVVQVPVLEQSLLQLINDKRARLNAEEQTKVEKMQVPAKPDDALLAKLNLLPWLV
ncbi:hypothetical protein LCGC14_0056240 [marine sediment metagenome]|uniref:AlgX/AlgJ SGNH hydrolase-like domain-containing protein n=1 Tax=marine sediment metagenome TaxID=412755 RepID=A0A0F9Y6T6_9ZZZZ